MAILETQVSVDHRIQSRLAPVSRTLGIHRVLVLISAYNESRNLPVLLRSLKDYDVLVVDDGSTDGSGLVAKSFGVGVMFHERRMGQAASIDDGISFALQRGYDLVVKVDADALPEEGSVQKLIKCFDKPDVGGASCRQVPYGPNNITYYIDELIWALLAEGKQVQMARSGSCYLGAVMHAFRPYLRDPMHGCVNEDERLDASIKSKGYRISFAGESIVYFDASSCLGHIFQRRKRMYFGHFKTWKSRAPSMQSSVSMVAIARTISKKPRRAFWLLPAIVIDSFARLSAWRDSRKPDTTKDYVGWVTTYAKNSPSVIPVSPIT